MRHCFEIVARNNAEFLFLKCMIFYTQKILKITKFAIDNKFDLR
jgi:hypothetical protein